MWRKGECRRKRGRGRVRSSTSQVRATGEIAGTVAEIAKKIWMNTSAELILSAVDLKVSKEKIFISKVYT